MFYDTPLLEIPGSSVPSAKCYSYSCYSRISDIPQCLKFIKKCLISISILIKVEDIKNTNINLDLLTAKAFPAGEMVI